MDVFTELVGQEHAAAQLRAAADDAPDARAGRASAAMTHAWLITGPPGSGRSTAALAFAAALVCPEGGCGRCAECVAVKHSAHADVEHVVPEGVTYTIAETHELVRRSALSPSRAPWPCSPRDRHYCHGAPCWLAPAVTWWVVRDSNTRPTD